MCSWSDAGEAPYEGMWAIPGGFKRPDETLDLRGPARALGGDGGRRAQSADAVRRLRRPRTRPTDERRHGGLPRRPPRRRRDRGGHRRGSRGARPRVADPGRADRARVRPPEDPAGRGRAGSGRARGVGDRDGVRRHDGFTIAELRAVYEAIWGVQLDAANFRRASSARTGGSSRPEVPRDPGPGGGRPAALYRAGDAWKHGTPIHRMHPSRREDVTR